MSNGPTFRRILVYEPRRPLADLITSRLNALSGVEAMNGASGDFASLSAAIEEYRPSIFVFSPLSERATDFVPDLTGVASIFDACTRSSVRRVVLLSSAFAYGADYHNPGMLLESRPPSARRPNAVASAWRALECLARESIEQAGTLQLTVLRPAMTVVPGATDWVNRLLSRSWALTLSGYDPSVQFVHASDLAEAVVCAVESGRTGTYNVAPDTVVPLRKGLRAAGVRCASLPCSVQRLARWSLRRWLPVASSSQQEFLRYSWTVDNGGSVQELGVRYRITSASAAASARSAKRRIAAELAAPMGEDDAFGMDAHFIHVRSRPLIDFFRRRYWRLEVRGLERIPRTGAAVLAGLHRGFMPFDGVMMVHLLATQAGRIPRFLIHPALVKFPFLAPFLTKLGGVVASQENADRVLVEGELLGIFPEGIRGAFRLYKEAYRIERFSRMDFVKMALRHQIPIIPFVFLGTAETFPILAKVEMSWWKRYTEWPFFPITPTFPLLPVPLPSKWHLLILPPINVTAEYSATAADDPEIVRRIGNNVHDHMQRTIDAMRSKRRSMFFGSIFDRTDFSGSPSQPALGIVRAATSEHLEPTVS